MSISLFPGAVDADLQGYAGSFFKRCTKLVGSCICFLISGGDLEALTEGDDNLDLERREEGLRHAAGRRLDHSAQNQFGYPDANALEHHDPIEPTRVIHRAITPLYAGTAPEAGRLNGRVGVSGLPILTYRLTGHIKMLYMLYSISLPGHASHFQVRRRSIADLRLSCGIGAKIRSRNTTRKTNPE